MPVPWYVRGNSFSRWNEEQLSSHSGPVRGSDLRASHQGRAGAWLTRQKRPGFREDELLGTLFITEAKF